jgi:HSP20 family protein
LEAYRASSWLASGPSGGGSYPPTNVFRNGDDYIMITEVPGIGKSDLEVQVKGGTIRVVRNQIGELP